jgi:hypothetical protein
MKNMQMNGNLTVVEFGLLNLLPAEEIIKLNAKHIHVDLVRTLY